VTGGIGAAFRQAHRDAWKLSLASATRVAEDWVEWATGHEDPAEAAEAYWWLVAATPRDTATRLFRPDKERLLSATQGTAAEAGWWLLRAGRTRDAVVAIERSRAVLLTETVQRERVGLRRLLDEVGRPDLYAAYLRASERLAAEERGQLQALPTPPATRAITVAGRSYHAAFTSTAQEAWSEHDQVLAQIARTLRLDGVDAPPTYEEVQAAAIEGPIVYLAAADRGGYAVIVQEQGPPRPIELPHLAADAVRDRARRFMDAVATPDEWWPGVLDDTVGWLWSAAMERLVDALPRRSLVTLVPVGALGLLPLHAARTGGGRDGSWRYAGDDLVLRAAPNARVLARARDLARGPWSGQLRALAVDAASADGHPDLRHSTAEVLAVARRFGPSTTVLRSATRGQVLAALPHHEIWHFACHGRADLERPLDSALLLGDGPLTLREVATRPAGRHRLAVLSACDTNVPDPALLDEVVSIPAGLLQAGVAGVVASSWKVQDAAAKLLVLRFHERWRAGLAPARALAEAQAWLRAGANGSFPADLYPPPPNLPAEGLAQWSSARPFEPPDAWAAFSYTGA
jgi:CHAT domain-containing protein